MLIATDMIQLFSPGTEGFRICEQLKKWNYKDFLQIGKFFELKIRFSNDFENSLNSIGVVFELLFEH